MCVPVGRVAANLATFETAVALASEVAFWSYQTSMPPFATWYGNAETSGSPNSI